MYSRTVISSSDEGDWRVPQLAFAVFSPPVTAFTNNIGEQEINS